MIVQRENNEILVRLSANLKTAKLQSILDYLKYEELTAKSTISDETFDSFMNEVKKGRWDLNKNNLGFND